jgi:hypothetical protein
MQAGDLLHIQILLLDIFIEIDRIGADRLGRRGVGGQRRVSVGFDQDFFFRQIDQSQVVAMAAARDQADFDRMLSVVQDIFVLVGLEFGGLLGSGEPVSPQLMRVGPLSSSCVTTVAP